MPKKDEASSKKPTIKAILEPFLSYLGETTICKACGKQGTKNMTRFMHHFLNCPEAFTPDAIAAKDALIQKTSKKVYSNNYNHSVIPVLPPSISSPLIPSPIIPEPQSSRSTATNANSSKKPRRSARNVDGQSQRANADLEKLYAKAFYVNCIGLNVTENATWISLFSVMKPSFQLPSRKDLTGRLLNEVFDEVMEKTKACISEAMYCCIAIDGWSNIRHEPIMNVLITTPKPLIVNYIESSCESKRAVNMASKIKTVLEEMCANKVVGIITDNSSRTPEMADILRANYSGLTFVVCTEYLLHHLCNDLLELSCFKQLQDDLRAIVTEVNRSDIKREVFQLETEKVQKSMTNTSVLLKSHNKTRCHTLYESLVKIQGAKQVLLNIGVENEFSMDTNVKKIIMGMNERNFWSYLEVFCNICVPIFECIQKVEIDKCCIAEIPFVWKRVNGAVSASISEGQLYRSDSEDVTNVVNKHANVSLQNDCILLSNLLHPCYRGSSLNDEQRQKAFEFLTEYATSLKYTVEDVLSVHDYLNKTGFFGIQLMKECNDPMLWWRTVGGYSKYKALSDIAVRVLSIPASTGVERFPSNLNIDLKSKKQMDIETTAKFFAVKNNLRSFEATVEYCQKSEDPESETNEETNSESKNPTCYITTEVDLPPEISRGPQTSQNYYLYNSNYH